MGDDEGGADGDGEGGADGEGEGEIRNERVQRGWDRKWESSEREKYDFTVKYDWVRERKIQLCFT